MEYTQLLELLKKDLYVEKQVHNGLSIPEWVALVMVVLLIIIAVWWALHALACVYCVWASRKDGEARLAEADRDQQIQVKKAAGRLDAAELNKKAAIVEAEAVSTQIEKIGHNLKEHDLYLKWQWIKMMEERPSNSTIYVPTEAGLPILEAGKRPTKNNMENLDV